jgi:Second Messenger Oligonucleotide or Dinucleotide Synthetase domain
MGLGEADARRREAEEASRQAQLDAEVNSLLNRRVIEVNRRDSERVNARLGEVESALGEELEGVDRLLFGGSVSKHTYVEGLSDIDALLVLNSSDYGGLTPSEVMLKLITALEKSLDRGEAVEIDSGELAVTVTYKEGLDLQLLPAVERGKELSIKAAGTDKWTAIEPKRFSAELSAVNQAQAGAVVPTIKLAKVILANAPESNWPTGYHLEALALSAFKDYNGPRNPKAMVTRFFDSAAAGVRKPIADLTGQSVHLDEALGAANSPQRRALAQGLERIATRMKNAPSADAWQALLGED